MEPFYVGLHMTPLERRESLVSTTSSLPENRMLSQTVPYSTKHLTPCSSPVLKDLMEVSLGYFVAFVIGMLDRCMVKNWKLIFFQVYNNPL